MRYVGSYPRSYGDRAAAGPVVVYGTRWCAQSQLVRRYLQRLGVPYEYVDLEANPAAAARLRWLTGSVSRPTVVVGDELLVEPTLDELQWALSHGGAYAW